MEEKKKKITKLKKIIKKEKRLTHAEVLLKNAEEVIFMLESGESYESIQNKFKVRAENVADFIHKSEYSARARLAAKNASHKYAKLALDSILAIQTGDDKAIITKQRELAHHYRWLAKVKSPKEYNENRQEGESENKTIPNFIINLKKE